MTDDVPDTAIAAAANVLAQEIWADDRFEPDHAEIARLVLEAAAPVIAAHAAAAERERILAAYWHPPFPRRPHQRVHEWRLLAVLNALTEGSPTTRRFTDADLLDAS